MIDLVTRNSSFYTYSQGSQQTGLTPVFSPGTGKDTTLPGFSPKPDKKMRYSNTLVHFRAKARTPLNSLNPRAKARGKSNSGERDFL